jgi:hypothetical protein
VLKFALDLELEVALFLRLDLLFFNVTLDFEFFDFAVFFKDTLC